MKITTLLYMTATLAAVSWATAQDDYPPVVAENLAKVPATDPEPESTHTREQWNALRELVETDPLLAQHAEGLM